MRLRSLLLSSSDLSAPLRWPYADFIACRKRKAGHEDGRLCARAHDESARGGRNGLCACADCGKTTVQRLRGRAVAAAGA